MKFKNNKHLSKYMKQLISIGILLVCTGCANLGYINYDPWNGCSMGPLDFTSKAYWEERQKRQDSKTIASKESNTTPEHQIITRPIKVIDYGPVLERSDALKFVTADNRIFEFSESWYSEEPIFSLFSKHYQSGRITADMPIRSELIDAFQEFMDSEISSAQLQTLYKRGNADYEALSKKEKIILAVKGYIEALKQIKTAKEVKKQRSFANLAEAVKFITECLNNDDYKKLAGTCLGREGAKSYLLRYRTPFDLLKNYNTKDKPFGDKYKKREFPDNKNKLKLGGHKAELGCVHIDFIKIDGKWYLEDIWNCR